MLADRYQLEEELGSGGAAVVWRAHDRSLDRSVAVKLLHPALSRDDGSVARFQREARSAATLNHRNVVAIYDIGEDGDDTFIVMEHVDGPGLDDVLGAGAMTPELVAAVGYQVASALGAAHDRGIVHRDVKPANILLSSTGLAKVADFGIAKAVDAQHTTLTRTGTMVGTVAYLAPEQIRDEQVDPRTDVYALGLVLHQALTGQPPFGRGTPAEVSARRLASDPPSPDEVRDDLPDDLVRVVRRATRLDRDARLPDGTALAHALEGLLTEDPDVLVRRLTLGPGRDRHRRDDTQVLPGRAEDSDETIAIDRPERRDDTPSDPDATQALGSLAMGVQGRIPAVLPSEPPAPPAAARSDAAGATDDASAPPGRGDGEPPAREERPSAAPRDADRPAEDDGGRGPLVPVGVRRPVMALVGGLVIVLAAVSALGGGDDPSGGSAAGGDGGGGGGDDPQAVEIAAVQDFDPFGDGEEHREDAPLAHDGDAGTAWVTERYDSADMGGLKPGVGLWFDLGASHDLARIELTVSPGIAFEVRVGGSAPEGTDPGAWGAQVQTVEGATGTVTIEAPEGTSGRYVVVWVTSVGGAGDRAEIAEAAFFAR